MKKSLFLTFAFMSLVGVRAIYAQDGQHSDKSADVSGAKADLPLAYKKWAKLSLDFSAGTRGLGVGARYRLGNSNWGIRLGYSYMPLAYASNLTLSGYQTKIDLFNNFQGVQLLAEYRPAKNSRFKLIGGLSYFYVARFKCDLTPTGSYMYGEQSVPSSQIGTVNAVIDWTGVAPFIGFGFGSPHPKHKVGCALGLGFYYLTQPSVTISGTNLLAGNSQNGPWLANNIANYRYLPVINFHINYRFKAK